MLLFATVLLAACAAGAAEPLKEIADFGFNPAGLRLYLHVPADMPANAPLVVALHGCTQEAGTYAEAGWREFADDRRFYLLMPEQSALEHPLNSCWSWFRAGDVTRGSGQAASILSMVSWVRAHYGVDTRRVYVDGLSAGGWLVPELLADYPDVFAGGSTHAGGPAFCAAIEQPFWDWFGAWTTMNGGALAAQCMRGADALPTEWASRVRAHAPQGWRGAWPLLSIWHGGDDYVVSPRNQRELLEQWTALQGIGRAPAAVEQPVPGRPIRHERYVDAAGRAVVETWRIEGMMHGIAIDATPGARCGAVSAFVLDAGVCAVRRVGAFWGL